MFNQDDLQNLPSSAKVEVFDLSGESGFRQFNHEITA
jgi:hypothetical protein